MTRINTNIMEIVLREHLIGKQFYYKNELKTIDDINFQPILNTVYVKSGGDGYYFSMNEMFDFELDIDSRPKIIPNKGKVKN